ncbi:uncharacterized protein [Penaeus vannamei]|uniref:uncharacterized protein n=1 Tax=Penaeus vannamei TaxID=6689 RepID=UPI00387F93BB
MGDARKGGRIYGLGARRTPIRLFENTDNVHNLTRDQFKKLLKLSMEDSVFMFNNQLYSQTDGVAMGSPLGPTLANTFLCHHENYVNSKHVNIQLTSEVEKLLELSMEDSVFMFNNQLYSQTDGAAMGSPLGPTLANAFLCHHESKWLADCPSHFKPVMYKRYVDDVFLLFNELSHVNMFLDYVNSKHVNIQFTSEVETGILLTENFNS